MDFEYSEWHEKEEEGGGRTDTDDAGMCVRAKRLPGTERQNAENERTSKECEKYNAN